MWRAGKKEAEAFGTEKWLERARKSERELSVLRFAFVHESSLESARRRKLGLVHIIST